MDIALKEIKQTTELCRYCLMCRHICPVTHVTRNEATSPHGWGILVASVERGVTAWNAETVDVLYQCADCGLCRAHCVTDQPLPLAINASRAEVVTQQKAPDVVYALQRKFQQWENPYLDQKPAQATAAADTALVVGTAQHLQPETVEAAQKLLAAAGIEVTPIGVGRESAYLPNSLGLFVEARQLAQSLLDEIDRVGAKRILVLSPGEVYTYQTIFGQLGLTWPDGVEVVEVTSLLDQQLEAGTLAFRPAELTDYTFYDPDHTVRVPGRWNAPRRLLAALSDTPPVELFWRQERAAPCGASGGLPFTQPNLAAQLAQARLAEAQERHIKTIITDDPYTLHHLKKYAGSDVTISGLFETLLAHLSQ